MAYRLLQPLMVLLKGARQMLDQWRSIGNHPRDERGTYELAHPDFVASSKSTNSTATSGSTRLPHPRSKPVPKYSMMEDVEDDQQSGKPGLNIHQQSRTLPVSTSVTRPVPEIRRKTESDAQTRGSASQPYALGSVYTDEPQPGPGARKTRGIDVTGSRRIQRPKLRKPAAQKLLTLPAAKLPATDKEGRGGEPSGTDDDGADGGSNQIVGTSGSS